MNYLSTLKLVAGGALAIALCACGGGGGGATPATSSAADSGSLRMALTDAPSCGYDAVNITIQSLRVNKNGAAADTDAGWSELVLNPARRINLLNLSNGVLEELGQIPLPTGKYAQLRLLLADNDASHPLANSVLPTGGTEVALKTPSGQQSGVKANIDIDIAANQMADFVLDFNACKSIVSAGNSGQYLLKPVVSVIPRYVAGVSGYVNPVLAGGATSVSLQQGGAVIKATAPDANGKFLLQPVAPGSYTLVLAAPGRTTAAITNVVVSADTVTAINSASTGLLTPVSASGTAKGTAPVNTLVRVVQPLSSGVTLELAGQFVDGATGSYSYPLVVNAPLVAPYVAAPGVLLFTADVAAAGKYTLNASLAGFADKAVVLPILAAGAVVVSNFTFP